jgi:hypothetical protein
MDFEEVSDPPDFVCTVSLGKEKKRCFCEILLHDGDCGFIGLK